MSADNKRLVVVLGQTDFSAGLADRINASRRALEEPEIAVALVAQTMGSSAKLRSTMLPIPIPG